MPTTLKLIKKKDEITAINGAIIDNLDSNSNRDAPSIRAVNEQLDNLNQQFNNYSNPNFLINADFRNPINQRKQTTYSGGTNKVYTIDRWCTGDADYSRTVEIVEGGVKVTNPNTEYVGTFKQLFEKVLPSDNYTATVKVKQIISGGGTFSCLGSMGSTRVTLSEGINHVTLNDATINGLEIMLAPNSSIIFEWAKIEQGLVSTPFIPKPYDDELSICRRYYRQYSESMLRPQFYSNQYYGFIFGAPMRVAPTVKTLLISSTNDGSYISGSAEVNAEGVYKFFTPSEYTSAAIIVDSLELDAEIY